jgi:hypothetical protein
MENSGIFKQLKDNGTFLSLDHDWMEQWNFQNNETTMEHSDHWIMTGRHGEQWGFQNNENLSFYCLSLKHDGSHLPISARL